MNRDKLKKKIETYVTNGVSCEANNISLDTALLLRELVDAQKTNDVLLSQLIDTMIALTTEVSNLSGESP